MKSFMIASISIHFLMLAQHSSFTDCSRILMGVMPQGRSHAGSVITLMNRLKEDGHTIDFYMEAYPDERDFGLNKKFIHINNTRNPFASSEYEKQQWMFDFGLPTQMYAFSYGSDSCQNVLNGKREEFNNLVNSQYDLILTDSLFSTCLYAIATMNKAHHVVMYSTNVETSTGTMRAFGSNWMLTPRSFMPLQDLVFRPEHFYYRLTGAYDWLGSVVQNVYVVGSRMSDTLKETIPDFSFATYISTASMALTDMPPDLFVPFPRTNDLFEFGSHCSESKPLPADLDEFVSDHTSKGTILIAFGTVINWKAAPAPKLKAIVDTVNSLTDYRILWSYNGNPINIGRHVKLSRWLPQIDILNHNKTVLYFSHGGLKSVKEASCSSTPSILMPMFAEQASQRNIRLSVLRISKVRNAWLASHHGFGEIVSKHSITTQSLRKTMLNVINTKRYQEAATRVQTLYKDKVDVVYAVVPSLDEGAHRVRKLLHYGGRMPEYFYPSAIQMPFFKYLSIDFIFVLPTVVILLVSV